METQTLTKKLLFVWKLRKKNLVMDKHSNVGIARFGNVALYWYIGTEDEIDERYIEDEDFRYDFCNSSFIVVCLMTKNMSAMALQNKIFLMNAFETAIKENIDITEFDEWNYYNRNMSLKLICRECNAVNLCDSKGNFEISCKGIWDKELCKAEFQYAPPNEMPYYAVSISQMEEDERIKQTELMLRKKESELLIHKIENEGIKLTERQIAIKRATDGKPLTQIQFGLLPQMIKAIYLDQYKTRQLLKAEMMIMEADNKKRFTDKEKQIDENPESFEDDEAIKKVCTYYLTEVIYMADNHTFGLDKDREKLHIKIREEYSQLFTIPDKQSGHYDEVRSRLHSHLAELTGMSTIHIANASSAFGNVLGLPIAKIMAGDFSYKQLQRIIMEYSNRFFKWLQTQKSLIDKGEIIDHGQ